MGVEQLVAQLNWIDYLILGMLIFFSPSGMARGFVLGSLDLAGVSVSLILAIGIHPQGSFLEQIPGLPEVVRAPLGFLAVVMATHVAYSAALDLLRRRVGPILPSDHVLVRLDRALGMVPGGANGVLVAVALLFPVSMFNPFILGALTDSAVGSRLVSASTEVRPWMESFGSGMLAQVSGTTEPSPSEVLRFSRVDFAALAPDPNAEQQLLQFVNEARVSAGLKPLAFDAGLRGVARAYSQELFQAGHLAHSSPTSGSPDERMDRAGLKFERAGENLAYAPSVWLAHAGLMRSPGHRANVLRPEFRRLGIGIIRSNGGFLVISEEFTD